MSPVRVFDRPKGAPMKAKRLGAGLAAIATTLTIAAGFAPAHATVPTEPVVVIAHVDAGINPYANVFRDTSPLAQQYPGTYIPGYPSGPVGTTPAPERLDLTLDAPTWQDAFNADKPKWDALLTAFKANPTKFGKRLFWIPGTKIVGAKVFGTGGVYCPATPVAPAPFVAPQGTCVDYPILDDFGHGTMTATRMGGNQGSLCPTCRIVDVEGLGEAGVAWLANQGWIDVQTNSWAYLTPAAYSAVGSPGTFTTIEAAAAKMPVYFATGNGTGGAAGYAPCPTEESATLVKGAIWVGAHDNGHVAAWSCAPAQIVADGYGGLSASNHSIEAFGPNPFACCTSAASPYAAGEGAAIIREARAILGDTSTGWHSGIGAQGTPPAGLTAGPLADGKLTLDELISLVKNTAEARPGEGKDDGMINWSGDPRAPDPMTEVAPYGPGANPYCQGCNTLPIKWSDVPADFPAYASIGYGGINERSLALAIDVLNGAATEPSRADVDAFFASEAAVRDVTQHPEHYLPV